MLACINVQVLKYKDKSYSMLEREVNFLKIKAILVKTYKVYIEMAQPFSL
jgi:hypothetical protein